MSYNKEKQKEYSRKYYLANKERLKTKTTNWSKEHKDSVAESKRKWAAKNREVIRAKYQEYKKTLTGCLSAKLKHLKKRKSSREIPVQIDLEFLLNLWEIQQGKCAISDYPMVIEERTLFGVSVDRIDSSCGYAPGNVQLVCQGVNFGKNSYSNEEMIEFWFFQGDAKMKFHNHKNNKGNCFKSQTTSCL